MTLGASFWVSILEASVDSRTQCWREYHDHFLRYEPSDWAGRLTRHYYIELGSRLRYLECGYVWRPYFKRALADYGAKQIWVMMWWAFDHDCLRETVERGQEKLGTREPYLICDLNRFMSRYEEILVLERFMSWSEKMLDLKR